MLKFVALGAALFAAPASVSPGAVVSAVTGAWDGSGGANRAVLIDDPANLAVDLAIYVDAIGDTDHKVTLAAFAHDIAPSGTLFGTIPELRQTRDGALILHSESTAGGGSQWTRDMQLAWRNGHFVVAGVRLKAWDPRDPAEGGSCDLNYLNGKGSVGKSGAVKVAAGGIPVEAWTEARIPNDCVF